MKATALRLTPPAVVLAALVLGAGSALAAAHVRADASFVSDEGCVSTEVFVFVKDAKAHIQVKQFDNCAEKELLNAVARNVTLRNGGLVVDPTLASASLDAAVDFTDTLQKNARLPGAAHVAWRATDEAVSVAGATDVDAPGKKSSRRAANKTSRLAQANGVITVNNQTITLSRAEDATIVITAD